MKDDKKSIDCLQYMPYLRTIMLVKKKQTQYIFNTQQYCNRHHVYHKRTQGRQHSWELWRIRTPLLPLWFPFFVFVFVSTFVFVFHLCNLPLWGNVYKQSASLAYFHIYRNPFSQTSFQSSIQNSDFPIFRRTLFSFCYGNIY